MTIRCPVMVVMVVEAFCHPVVVVAEQIVWSISRKLLVQKEKNNKEKRKHAMGSRESMLQLFFVIVTIECYSGGRGGGSVIVCAFVNQYYTDEKEEKKIHTQGSRHFAS